MTTRVLVVNLSQQGKAIRVTRPGSNIGKVIFPSNEGDGHVWDTNGDLLIQELTDQEFADYKASIYNRPVSS